MRREDSQAWLDHRIYALGMEELYSDVARTVYHPLRLSYSSSGKHLLPQTFVDRLVFQNPRS